MIETTISYNHHSLPRLDKKIKGFYPVKMLWEPTGKEKVLTANQFAFASKTYREAIHRISVILALNQTLQITDIKHKELNQIKENYGRYQKT